MNTLRNGWLQMMKGNSYKYLLTITFNKPSKNSDKDIDRFIRIIHQHLFGKNFINQCNLLGLVIIRERKPLSSRNHYHILIEERNDITLELLTDAIVYASKKCDTIQTLYDGDKETLTRNFRDQNFKNINELPVNLQEIQKSEMERTINYVLKDGFFSGYENIHVTKSNSNEMYFPISTGIYRN